MKTIFDFARYLRERDDILLLGHVNPDGDCSGSAVALALALSQLGKRACVFLPGGLPHMLDFLPGADRLTGEVPFAPRCAVAVDVSDQPRLGEEGMRLFLAAPERAVLDHHGTNAGFGDICVVDGSRGATGEMVLELIEAMGVPLSREMGEWLFAAISTDTGNMNYDNTRAETLRCAAKCLDAGVSCEKITRMLYRTRSLSRTKLLGLTLARLEMHCSGRVAVSCVTRAMYEDAGATQEDTEGIVNYLLEIAGVRIALLAEEWEVGRTKFSLRSVAPFNVARDIALPLGGGGHDRAAGCRIDLPPDEAMRQVLTLAEGALERA